MAQNFKEINFKVDNLKAEEMYRICIIGNAHKISNFRVHTFQNFLERLNINYM